MYNVCLENERQVDLASERDLLVGRAERVADDIFLEADLASRELPVPGLRRLHEDGFLTAPLPAEYGGLGLGTTRGGHRSLLRCLAAIGGADLALGRLYEGHVNALILIHAYGTAEQTQRAADDARDGKLFGVWNTGDRTPMRLESQGADLLLQGCKTFATGAGFVDRPIVTAERNGWQMTLPRMESPAVASQVRLDRDAWKPLGMESSQSLTIDFGGARIDADDLIGRAGDLYREPLFRGGAIRFAAVQAGAVLRLADLFSDWLTARDRGGDPYQIARLGEVELLAQGAALWVDRAADLAEECLWPGTLEPASNDRMIQCGNMTRLAIERAATATMSHVIAGVGAHGLLQPARFERILRDLTMYLRQPSPDATLADVGRSTLMHPPLRYRSDPDSTGIASDASSS